MPLLIYYHELMEELQKLCDRKSTGTMFITTNDNHSVRFVLKQGEIIAFAYRFKYGDDALLLIQKVEAGTFAFKQNTLLCGKVDLSPFDTNTLLGILTRKNIPIAVDDENITLNHAVLLDTEIDHIKAAFSVFIGPIANFICTEYVEAYSKPANKAELEQMIAILAEEIGDEDNENSFKQQAKNQPLWLDVSPSSMDEAIAFDETRSFEVEVTQIRTELSVFIGPIANFICDEYIDFHKEPTSKAELERMIAVLAKEIGDKEQENSFKQNVMDCKHSRG